MALGEEMHKFQGSVPAFMCNATLGGRVQEPNPTYAGSTGSTAQVGIYRLLEIPLILAVWTIRAMATISLSPSCSQGMGTVGMFDDGLRM